MGLGLPSNDRRMCTNTQVPLKRSSHHNREVTAAEVLRGPVASCVAGEHNVSVFGDRDRMSCIVCGSPALCTTKKKACVTNSLLRCLHRLNTSLRMVRNLNGFSLTGSNRMHTHALERCL